MNGIIGRKIGMTQVFDETGTQYNVTVIEAGPCTVVQRKTQERDGYDAVQLGFEPQKEQRLTKPEQGHFKKAGVTPQKVLREFDVEPDSETKAGDEVTVAQFEGVPYVDIVATSKGRGFQGVMRRHGFGGGRATHGSGGHRRPGSIGMKEEPARVFKGKKLPGHMGNERVTTQNLKVVQVRGEDNALLVEGAVPGPVGGLVMVRKAIKKPAVKS
jgi:large subunit ribosomal protein L3